MKYALFVLSFVATQVFATGSNHHNVYDNSVVNRGGNAISDSYSNSTAGAYSGSTSNSNATSNSTSEGGNATGGNSDSYANNGGNSMNMSTTNNAPRQHHNTPSMPLFVPSPTATCMATIGGAGAGAGFGFSISGTYRSMHCEKVELAKTLNQLGQGEAALQVLCNVDAEHLEGVDLCEGIKEQRAAKIAAREAAKVAKVAKQVESVPTKSGSQVVAPDQVNAEVATNEGNGMFKFDPQAKQWVFNTAR